MKPIEDLMRTYLTPEEERNQHDPFPEPESIKPELERIAKALEGILSLIKRVEADGRKAK